MKKPIRIKATFTGTNSLGYEKGKEYELYFTDRGNSIVRVNGGGFCPYGSIRAFLYNWTNIQVIQKD